MNKKYFLGCCILLFTAVSVFAQQAKYVFYFIGDGMGVNQVLGTEYYLGQCKGQLGISPLLFTTFPYTGLATSFSASSDVTDSAAAGTALACGGKAKNGSLGVKDDTETPMQSVATRAKKSGKKVGIATSVTVNHATPASFYAHQKSRNDYYQVGLDLLQSNFDFFAGGDFAENKNPDNEKDATLYERVKAAGYSLVRGYKDFEQSYGHTDKLILIQKEGALETTIPYAIDAREDDLTLSEITEAAVNFLTKDTKKGFFLMVEGGKIDYACHANDAAACFQEVMDMDQAIQVAYRFYLQHPDETLIVVTADHETGGLALGNGKYELNFEVLANQKVSKNGFSRVINRLRHSQKDHVSWEQIKDALTTYFGFWDTVKLSKEDEIALEKEYHRSFESNTEVKMAESLYYKDEPMAALAVKILNRIAMVNWGHGSHTASYVPVFAIGAGAENFTGQMDNTDIPKRIAKVAGYK